MQSTSSEFGSLLLAQAENPSNKPGASLKIAWERDTTQASYAIVDQSVVDGPDVVKGDDDQVVTNPDLFVYSDETDRIIAIDWDRAVDDVYAGVTKARLNVVLDNYDQRFTIGNQVWEDYVWADFTDNQMPPDTSLFGAQSAINNNRIEITTLATPGYYGFYSNGFFDMTRGYGMSELVSISESSIPSLEILPVQMYIDDDNNLSWLILPDSNTINVVYRVEGSGTFPASDTYNPSVHKFFRIREKFGVTYWEYSTDGEEWVEFYSVANPIEVTNLRILSFAGNWDSESNTSLVALDNVLFRKDVGIGDFILPGRPIQFSAGYYLPTKGQFHLLNQFKGLIEGIPKENKLAKTVEITAVDYLSYVENRDAYTEIYENMTTDEILRDLFLRAGFGDDQLDLEEGINNIPFAWVPRGSSIGKTIHELTKAELGHVYQDEFGIMRFENRENYNDASRDTSVYTLDSSLIINWEQLNNQQIINKATVIGQPRAVDVLQEIWRNSKTEFVEDGETITITAQLTDPATFVNEAIVGLDLFANLQDDGSGADATSDFSVTTTSVTATTVTLEITNNGATDAYVTFLRLRGNPAIRGSDIISEYQDISSQDEFGFGVHDFTLSSEFLADEQFIEYLSESIVNKFKQPRRIVRLTIGGIPHFQLKDYITVHDPDTNKYIPMRIMRIAGTIVPGEFSQTLDLREITESEV